MFKTPFLLAAFCFLLAAPSLARGSFVYVTNYGDGTVSQFRANADGTLTPLTPPSVKAYPRCHSLAADPTGRFLYVLSALEFSRRDCLISQYRIGPNGTLTPLSPATVPVPYSGQGGGPFLVSVDPSGRFVYVPGRDGLLAQFHINADGTLAPLSPPFVGAGGGTLGVSTAFDRLHSTLYVSSRAHMAAANVGGVAGFAINPDGTLHLLPQSVLSMEGLTPESIFVSHGGKYAYILYNAYYGGGGKAFGGKETSRILVSQFRTQSSGKLDALKPPQVSLPGQADCVVVDPHSRFCYLIMPLYRWIEGDLDQRIVGSLRLYRCPIRPDGALGKPAHQTLPVRFDVSTATFDPSGNFLYLLTGNGVRPFRVKLDGSVVPLSSRSIHAGRGPLGMVYVQR